VGAGAAGAKIAHLFATVPHVAFSHVVDVDVRARITLGGEIAARQPKRPVVAPDVAAALADDAVRGIVVAVPDHAAADLAVRACATGKAVFLAGAPGLTIAEAHRVVEASARFGRPVQVRFPHRDHVVAYEARAYIERGELGRVSLVRVVSPLPPDPDRPADASSQRVDLDGGSGAPPPGLDWRGWLGTAPAVAYSFGRHRRWSDYWAYGGGPLLTNGLELIDLARLLMGDPPPPRSVISFGGGGGDDGSGQGSPGERAPRYQTAMCDFGVWQMVIESGHGTGEPRFLSGSKSRGHEAPFWRLIPRVEVHGSRAAMLFGTNGAGFCIYGVPAGEWLHEVHGAAPQSRHEQFFVENILKQTVPRASAQAAADSAVIAHLANASYRLGGRRLSFHGASTDCPEANAILGLGSPPGGGAGEPARSTAAGSAGSDGEGDEAASDAD
jgi:predicted dehydrogenase